MKFTNIKDKKPPIGEPLIVQTYNSIENKSETKYPVYYLKEPYENKYAWYFFPACEGICKLLPEYSDVFCWKSIWEEY